MQAALHRVLPATASATCLSYHLTRVPSYETRLLNLEVGIGREDRLLRAHVPGRAMLQAFDALRTGATFNRKRFRSDVEYFQGTLVLQTDCGFCSNATECTTCSQINARTHPVHIVGKLLV